MAPPPELMAEFVEEILLRVPPDEPAHLARAVPIIPSRGYSAAVLSAVRSCDHLHCRGGPFFVVFVSDSKGKMVRPHLYSSEEDAWNASADQGPGYISIRNRSALIGDDIYFVLIPRDTRDVVAGWVQCMDIELQTPLPFRCSVEVVGSAEGLGTIFVATDIGVFTIELKSGRERKVGECGKYYTIFSFMSFYTPDCASSLLPSPAEAH
ncbi:unnamed protein product [Urochloa decumbens]|uniref:Uncharacterized protein n=1 Tax=Urochloa decumbens TaxID=240449 RepID=A0ABC9FN78_9POAL